MLPSSNSNNLLYFSGLWKGLVPSKIEVFCRMAILDKINMRKGLARRGIIAISESIKHLFLHCRKQWCLWARFIKWWRVCWVFQKDMESIFQQWECLFIGGFRRKCSWMMLSLLSLGLFGWSGMN